MNDTDCTPLLSIIINHPQRKDEFLSQVQMLIKDYSIRMVEVLSGVGSTEILSAVLSKKAKGKFLFFVEDDIDLNTVSNIFVAINAKRSIFEILEQNKEKKKTLSIICTHRGREDRIDDFISHYSKWYPKAEILMLHQADNDKFKKGQLYNIGSQYAKGNILAFIDIDIRLQHFIDVVALSNVFCTPFYPYESIVHCSLSSNSTYEILPRPCWQYSPGGFYVFTRQQYISVNGHSNLYLGHSYEDTEMRERGIPKRYPDSLLHIAHSNNIRDRKAMLRNKILFESRNSRDIQKDGITQTTHELVLKKEVTSLITKYEISNIGVTSDFVYKHLFKEIL